MSERSTRGPAPAGRAGIGPELDARIAGWQPDVAGDRPGARWRATAGPMLIGCVGSPFVVAALTLVLVVALVAF